MNKFVLEVPIEDKDNLLVLLAHGLSMITWLRDNATAEIAYKELVTPDFENYMEGYLRENY